MQRRRDIAPAATYRELPFLLEGDLRSVSVLDNAGGRGKQTSSPQLATPLFCPIFGLNRKFRLESLFTFSDKEKHNNCPFQWNGLVRRDVSGGTESGSL